VPRLAAPYGTGEGFRRGAAPDASLEVFVQETGLRNGTHGADKFGFKGLAAVHWNLTDAPLYEHAIANREAQLVHGGGLCAETGVHTGRSPKDKYIVCDDLTNDTVWWENNGKMTPAQFARLYQDFIAHSHGKTLYTQDLRAGADAEFGVRTRVFTQLAWHSLFIRTLLLRPNRSELATFVPELTIYCCPTFKADPKRHGVRSDTVIAIDFTKKIVLIGGSSYAGEIKKAVFSFASGREFQLALERTIEESDGLIRTFNALLMIARAESGQARGNMGDFDAAEVANGIHELYEPLAEDDGMTLRVKTAPTPLHGNRELISQALANLVENAIKYGKPVPAAQPLSAGAVTGTDGKEILIEACREGDQVLLSVTDHGPGIPETDRRHAVERFVRLEASRTQPGSGLGLSLASAVATLHGGELRLGDAHPGLTATLVIPALAAARDRLAAQTPDVPHKVA